MYAVLTSQGHMTIQTEEEIKTPTSHLLFNLLALPVKISSDDPQIQQHYYITRTFLEAIIKAKKHVMKQRGKLAVSHRADLIYTQMIFLFLCCSAKGNLCALFI